MARQWYCGHIVSTVSVSGKSVNYSALGDGTGTREDVQTVVFGKEEPDCVGGSGIATWNVKQKTCTLQPTTENGIESITDTSITVHFDPLYSLMCELTPTGVVLEEIVHSNIVPHGHLISITI